MCSLASLIVELQSARRRLLKAFEVLNGTPMVGLRPHRIPNGRKLDRLLMRIKFALKCFRYNSDNPQAMEIGQPRQQI
jgi:hypothetical protein